MADIGLSKFVAEHPHLIAEYEAFDSPEERLAWLMERSPLHPPVPDALCTAERRVPGCLSGLWLHGTCTTADGCVFSARSESAMVQGVVSLLCDLYSGRSPQEVVTLGASLAKPLRLEGVLSLTRRRAVESAIAFFVSEAAAATPVADVA